MPILLFYYSTSGPLDLPINNLQACILILNNVYFHKNRENRNTNQLLDDISVAILTVRINSLFFDLRL